MGRHGGKTENDTLLRSHITLAYFYVETWIKRQTADEAIDFVSIRTEFEYVERFVRYRSSKCMWSKQKSWIRVSHAQNECKLECWPVLRIYKHFYQTNRRYGQNIHFKRTISGNFVATLVLFHPMSLPKRWLIQDVNYSPQSAMITAKLSNQTLCKVTVMRQSFVKNIYGI